MGTRNLTCVVVDGVYKVAQYGQFDGYPSGQGATALEFLHSILPSAPKAPRVYTRRHTISKGQGRRARRIRRMWARAAVRTSQTFSANLVRLASNCRALRFLTDAESKQRAVPGWASKWPWLHRNCAAKILSIVYAGTADAVANSIAFAKDSLFCEWAYVVDLDRQTFEVYRGFNTTPPPKCSRFFSDTPNDGGYYPIAPLASWSLRRLPDVQRFVAECEPV